MIQRRRGAGNRARKVSKCGSALGSIRLHMECKLTVSVVEESVEGNIGDDWKYSVTATVIDANGKSIESGRIRVPEHQLKPGTLQPPPQAAGVKIRAGACGSFAKVELRLDVTEVDWLVDDPGSKTVMVPIDCPAQGKPPFTKETVISIHVRERPKLLGGEATFKLKVRLVATCVG